MITLCVSGLQDLETRVVNEARRPEDAGTRTETKPGLRRSSAATGAIRLYFKAQEQGIRPDTRAVLSALKACRSSRDLENGRRIHRDLARNEGGLSNVYVANSLLDLYAKCNRMAEAREVFEKMEHRNVVSWTSMIQGFARSGEELLALEYFERMSGESCVPDEVTFVAALKACCGLAEKEQGVMMQGKLIKLGSLERGKALHSQADESGNAGDLFVQNTLIDLYAKCGSLVDARRVFDSMKTHDVVSWNSIIFAHAENQEGEEALKLFSRMQREGCAPNRVTHLATVKACAILGERGRSEECLRLGRAVAGAGDVAVANALVDMYGKCGSLADAREVFHGIQNTTTVSWNSIILACARNGEVDLALEYYRRMREKGCAIDDVTLLGVLKACSVLAGKGEDAAARARCLKETREIHSQAMKTGKELELFVLSTLVDVYSKCGSPGDARLVFEKMRHRNVVSWNCIILSHAQHGLENQAIELFDRMQQEGCKPDSGTFVAVLKACGSLAEAEKLMKTGRSSPLRTIKWLHSQTAASGLEMDIFVANTLLDSYGKCLSSVDAHILFESMRERSLISWNCITLAHALCGGSEIALELFAQLQDDGFQPDTSSFVAGLKACSSSAEKEDGRLVREKVVKTISLARGKAIHSHALRVKQKLETNLESLLVDMYSKCGSLADARRVQESQEQPDVYCWTSLILGYAQNGEPKLALGSYSAMRENGCEPDKLTFAAVLQACSILPALETGRRIHQELAGSDLESDEFLANALISFYGKCGCMGDAERVFGGLRSKSVVSWSALIAGYSSQGNSERVFQLFERMKEQEVRPDSVTYTLVLNACVHAGCVDKGKGLFREMVEEGVRPGVEHYSCVVEILGRADELGEAAEMLRSLGAEAGVMLWMVLLGACWKWRNAPVGKVAFEEVLRLDSGNASAYILMSNICSVCGLQEESRRVEMFFTSNKTEENS